MAKRGENEYQRDSSAKRSRSRSARRSSAGSNGIVPSAVVSSSSAAKVLDDTLDNEFDEGLSTLLFESLQSNDENRVAIATEDLYDYCETEQGCEEVFRLGGHSILVLTMKKWRSRVDIQAAACYALNALVNGYPDNQMKQDLVSSLHKMGAMELVVRALTKFRTSQDLQMNAIATAGNMCFVGSDHDKKRAATLFVYQLGGVPLLVAAMKAFPRELEIQNSCWLVKGLCALGMEKAPVMQGEVLTLFAALQAFPQCEYLKKATGLFMKAVLLGETGDANDLD
ncbi:expressed unknown protein [Seminavis robusta]|uniref:Uncharacterized protein n=1 Tax=Seminavis robusta TaxID=568900 RepID=A0A9N8HNL0_9STRA|nr:expressed unknown protein [Seminavis robusta]|eukprot:Sro1225_g254120.1 n/a (283) ;mRNA; r:24383-25310